LGPNKQVNMMVDDYHGPAHSPKTEYELGNNNQVTSMDILKRSDTWIADSGESNHVTFSDRGCRNKRIATGFTHGIVGDSVLSKCELAILTKMEHKWVKFSSLMSVTSLRAISTSSV
jgi:hypothetical protein